MTAVSMRDMLEAGVHFGHQTRFWNPKMRPYIFGERNKIHIIDLEKSLPLYNDALNFLGRMAASGGTILFVGTKRAAQECIAAEAQRCAMPYVNRRWLGGMLTNYRTVKQSIKRLKELEALIEEGGLDRVSKKEGLSLQRELAKLERGLGGIKNMDGIPDVLFIIDVGYEKIAVAEAVTLGIPVVAVVDTNNAPDGVDYIIPGNDDAIRSIELYVSGAATAVLEGRESAQLEVAAAVGSGKEADDESAGTGKAARKKKPPVRKKTVAAAKKSAPSGQPVGEPDAAGDGGEAAGTDGGAAVAGAKLRGPTAEQPPPAMKSRRPTVKQPPMASRRRPERGTDSSRERGGGSMRITAAMVKELRERTGAGMMDCKRALTEAEGDLEKAVGIMRLSGQAKADKKAGRITAEGVVAIRRDDTGRRAAMVEINCETDFVAKEAAFRGFVDAVCARVLAAEPDDLDGLAGMPLGGEGGPSVEEERRGLVAKIGENISVRRFVVIHSKGGRLGSYLHGTRIGVVVDLEGADDVVARDIAMHVAASRPVAVAEGDMPEEMLGREREILEAQVAESGKPAEIQRKMLAGRIAKFLKEVTLLGQPFVKDPDRTVKEYLGVSGAAVLRFERFEVGEGIERKTGNFAEEVLAQARGH